MIRVKHFVARSKIHGLGVFAAEHVYMGQTVWRHDPHFDVDIPRGFLKTLAQEDIDCILNCAEYLPESDIFRLGNDADIFMNHSDVASLTDHGDVMVAARNIHSGEELTCNYDHVTVLGFRPGSKDMGRLLAQA